MKILGIGDNVVDVYRHTRTYYPGGNAVNVPVYALGMGADAAYMGVLGDDEEALHLHRVLEELGVDISHCRMVAGETGRAEVDIVEGDRVFVGGNGGGVVYQFPLQLTALDEEYIKGFDVLHSSCYSAIEDQLPRLHGLGVPLSYDFSEEFTDEYLEKNCPHVDIAVFSCAARPEENIRELLKRVHRYGPYLIIATRGKRGALLSYNGMVYEQAPCLVKAVDTMGAGDAFLAAFLVGFFDGMQYCRDFPVEGGGAGIVRREEYIDALIRLSLSRAAVYSSENCMKDGAFGYGKGCVCY